METKKWLRPLFLGSYGLGDTSFCLPEYLCLFIQSFVQFLQILPEFWGFQKFGGTVPLPRPIYAYVYLFRMKLGGGSNLIGVRGWYGEGVVPITPYGIPVMPTLKGNLTSKIAKFHKFSNSRYFTLNNGKAILTFRQYGYRSKRGGDVE